MARSNLKKKYAKYGYLYSLPFIIAFSMFFLYPTVLTFILGFTDLKGAGNTEWHFLTTVGKPWYQNFEDVIKSKTFWKAFANTWLFWISGFIPELFLAFLFSVWYSDRRLKIKGTLIFKIIYYMPHLVAGSVTATLFIKLFGYPVGTVNQAMEKLYGLFGATWENRNFLINGGDLKKLVVLINVYMFYGYTLLIIYSGIIGINPEIFESAEMDGCNRIQTFFKITLPCMQITLPCMREILIFVLVTSIIGGLGMFDVPQMFGVVANNAVITNMTYLNNLAFRNGYIYNRAAALSIMLLILNAICSGIIFYLMRDKDEEKLKKIVKRERREARGRYR